MDEVPNRLLFPLTGEAAVERGNYLRRIREELGYSQAKLAELAGTSQQTIDRLEKGQVAHSRALPRLVASLQADVEGKRFFLQDKIAKQGEAVLQATRADVRLAQQQGYLFESGWAPEDFQSLVDPETGKPTSLPIFRFREQPDDTEMLPVPFTYMLRPSHLELVPNVYGLQVSNDLMKPIFLFHDVILINPNKIARVGQEVVACSEMGAGQHRTIWTLNGATREHWLLGRPDTPETKLHRLDWPRLEVVVARYYR